MESESPVYLPDASDDVHEQQTDSSGFAFRSFMLLLLTSFAALYSLVGSALKADERFALYEAGGRYGWNFLAVIRQAIAEIPSLFQRGMFRPIGRLIGFLEHTAAYQLSVATHIPVYVTHGMFRILAAAILGFMSLRLAQQYLPAMSNLRRNFGSLFVVAYAVHLVAAGSSGPPSIFPWTYMITATVGLGVALLMGRLVRRNATLDSGMVFVLVLTGLAISMTNELAIMGIAIALANVVLLSWVHRRSLWNRATQGWLIVAGAFLTVFVPMRILMAGACATGTCYTASDLGLTTWTPEFFVARLLSGTLLPSWAVANRVAGFVFSWSRLLDYVIGFGGFVVAVGVGTVILIRTRQTQNPTNLDPDGSSNYRPLTALLIFGFSIAAAGALMASLSAGLQEWSPRIGMGWRESGFGFSGWSIVATSLVLIAVEPIGDSAKPFVNRVVYGCFALALAVTGFLNSAVTQRDSTNSEAMLNNQIASSLSSFDTSGFGNEFRCSLMEEWSIVYDDKQYDFRPRQLESALNLATRRTFHRDFCDAG